MNKRSLEISTCIGAIIIFLVLIAVSKILMASSAGIGYAVSLLVFIVIMGSSGLKLAEIPE
jgi:hypothetical protein